MNTLEGYAFFHTAHTELVDYGTSACNDSDTYLLEFSRKCFLKKIDFATIPISEALQV